MLALAVQVNLHLLQEQPQPVLVVEAEEHGIQELVVVLEVLVVVVTEEKALVMQVLQELLILALAVVAVDKMQTGVLVALVL
jgi:hypothetical protein